MDQEYSVTYNYNNISYNIITNNETHVQLQNDPEFFNSYIRENMASCEAVGIQEKENDLNIGNFTWGNQTTKLLLQKYYERKDKFRDPKIKKKLLWMEIVEEFKLKGYNITDNILDRKMRNLKQSYKSIKYNNKKTNTGRGRITWEWFDTMEDLFKEDRTINVGATLSSMITNNSRCNIEQASTSSIPSTSTQDEHFYSVQSDIDCAHSESTENSLDCRSPTRCVKEFIRGNSYVSNWLDNCAHLNFCSFLHNKESNNYLDKNVGNVKLREQLFISSSSIPVISSQQSATKNLKEKAARTRTLYNQRKQMVDCEERRVEAINKLCEKIEEHNRIQQERNDILKLLVSSQIRDEEKRTDNEGN